MFLASNFRQAMESPESTTGITNGSRCRVIAGTHKGKTGEVQDLNINKTGHVTINVVQNNGVRFKTLARNVERLP